MAVLLPDPDPDPEPEPVAEPATQPAGDEAVAPVVPASLSPSRAADFQTCPLRYRFRTVDRLPQRPSAAAARGTVVHAVLERLFDLPASERTVEAARALLGPQWQRVLEADPALATLFPDGAGDDDGAALAQWLESADALVRRWFDLEDPTRLEPADREALVEARLDDGLVLRGYVDRLDMAPDGQVRVVDYKTGCAPRVEHEAWALFQMRFYALVLWRTHGVVPAMLQLVYLGDGQVLRFFPDEADLLATERKVRALWEAIEHAAVTGDWQPSPGRACDWCDHRSLCPVWGGTPPPLPPPPVVVRAGPADYQRPNSWRSPARSSPASESVIT